MNEYLDPMFPDEGHLRHFPDDANSDNPAERFRRPGILAEVRPGAYALAIAIGMGLACVIALCSGCSVAKPPCVLDAHGELNYPCVITAETMAQERRLQAKIQAEQMRLLKEQHKDVSKTMKDFRMP